MGDASGNGGRLAERIPLGASGIDVCPICLGGNVFGWTIDENRAMEVLDAYVAAGGNFIDTADVYSAWAPGNHGGESETIIGRWLQRRGKRDDLVLATKVGELEGCEGLSAKSIRRGIEGSLRRMQLDHIDVYYAHDDDPAADQLETMSAFDGLVQEGKVRCVAASNYSAPRLRSALRASRENALTAYVGLQVHYNLMHREEYEDDLALVCEEEGLACMPYWALASGFLSGKYRSEELSGARAHQVRPYANPRGFTVLRTIDSIAEGNAASAVAVALAWLRGKSTVTAPVTSATSTEQLGEIVSSVGLALTHDEMTSLDRASADGVAAEG